MGPRSDLRASVETQRGDLIVHLLEQALEGAGLRGHDVSEGSRAGELPELVEYHRRLEGREDVVLLSFNVTDERADIEAFVAERDVPFRVYLGDDLLGPYEVVAFPTKLVIDMREAGKDDAGVVRFRSEGYTSAASIEARVEELLASAP